MNKSKTCWDTPTYIVLKNKKTGVAIWEENTQESWEKENDYIFIGEYDYPELAKNICGKINGIQKQNKRRCV